MKPRRYIATDGIYPFKGLNTLTPSVQLSPDSSPDCLNMRVDKGVLTRRYGYKELGDTLDGTVLALIEFQNLAGSSFLVAITTTKQYKYDATSDTWDNITYQVAATDVDWTGDETNVVNWAVLSGVDDTSTYSKWLVVTNGKDAPRYWDGSMGTFALYEPNIPNFVTCKTIALHYDHVVLGNIQTTSWNPQLIAWSSVQKLVDFTSVGSNDAGEALLTNISGEIQQLVPLGDRLMVYADNSIDSMAYVGGDVVYNFDQLMRETRLVSARGIVNIGPYHMFMSEENVTLFDGTRSIRTTGDAIFRRYREELYVNDRHRAFAAHDVARQKVYFAVPVSNDKTIFYVVEYDNNSSRDATWVREEYGHRPTTMGFSTRDSTLTWDANSLVGVPWTSMAGRWSSGTVRKGWPVRIMGTVEAAFFADDTYLNDTGEGYESFWDTPDFSSPQEFQSTYTRWIEIEFEARGYQVEVLVSLDEGSSFKAVQDQPLTSQWTKYKIPVDEMSETMRIRFQNVCLNSNFEIRWFRVWYKAGGAR